MKDTYDEPVNPAVSLFDGLYFRYLKAYNYKNTAQYGHII